LAIRKLRAEGKLAENPVLGAITAVSVGIVEGRPLLDLCYTEDAAASVDLNWSGRAATCSSCTSWCNVAKAFTSLGAARRTCAFKKPAIGDSLMLGLPGGVLAAGQQWIFR
jgi:hypothetical protein